MVSRFAGQQVNPDQVVLMAQMDPTDPALYENNIREQEDRDDKDALAREEADRLLMEALKKRDLIELPYKMDQPNRTTPSEGVGDMGIPYREGPTVDPQDFKDFYTRNPITGV